MSGICSSTLRPGAFAVIHPDELHRRHERNGGNGNGGNYDYDLAMMMDDSFDIE